MRRLLLVSALVLVLAAVGAVGWYYSGEILGPDAPLGETGQRVIAHTDSTITLAATHKARRPGSWAIVWPGGYGRTGPLIDVGEERVVTHFQIASGAPPDTSSRLAGFAPKADPMTWLGVEFENVDVPSRAGPLPSWFVPGTDSTWVIFVHGRAATRAEVLRMLPSYMSLGLPCLVISYRNDPDGPQVGDGSYRLGVTEWEDLEDAVRYAREHGAQDVVLVGCSMGGGIVTQFLRRSPEVAVTRAAVLDAPALDWNHVLAFTSDHMGVPSFVTEWGKVVTSWRSGIDWSEVEQVPHAAEFSTPMLIFHGDADDTVPAKVSEDFAKALPDLVQLEIFEGAGHVESVNFDGERYRRTIRDWLRSHGVGANSAPEPGDRP